MRSHKADHSPLLAARPRSPLSAARAEVVTDERRLDELVGLLSALDRYALDTEFHRERTYWPRLALVQVAWEETEAGPSGVALIDPLAVDIRRLEPLLGSDATMVAHAAEQDLEVLLRACGRVPNRLLDTQVAAGFCGYGSSSLAALSARYLGVTVAKGDRLTDWSRRPLTASQMAYAAADVDHLLELADAIGEDLDRRGRRQWAIEECATVLARDRRPAPLEQAWWKIRDNRSLRGTSRGVAQEVAAWREARARRLDVPPRTVVPDLALQVMAQRPPKKLSDLAELRGMERRYLKDGVDEEIMEAVERGRRLPASEVVAAPAAEVSSQLRPMVAIAAAWVAQLAHDEQIDAALLATRADLVAYLRGDEDTRLSKGWRSEMVGRRLQKLLAGDAAVAVTAEGRLVLEARSGERL